MKLKLLYFASIREGLRLDGETWDTESATVGALRDELLDRGGAYAEVLARGRAVRVAVERQMQNESASLHDGAEIAFFPPVTGG